MRCITCHTCAACSTEKPAQSFAGKSTRCIQCENLTTVHRCDACAASRPASAFDPRVLGNATKYGRRKVCLECTARGFSPRDATAYPCAECGDKGHLRFERNALENYKARGRPPLVCTICIARHRAIEEKLKDKKSARCTCKGPQAQRRHDFSNERCGLYPQMWPGHNNEISIDDWKFAERMRKRRRTS